MKIHLVVALVGLAIGFAVPAFAQQTNSVPEPAATATAQQKDTVDPQIAEQIRALALKFDEAFDRNDPVAVAAFITEDAIWTTPHGKLSGRDVIEADYANHVFRYHSNDLSTKFDRVDAVGNDIRATGTWTLYFSR
jgi:hypothetical protein